ncbi:hypothetical protein NA644_07395 [Pseudomonas stutzeri]|uniref:Uncharacterized protein n=2 Tax=Pseudomonadaceae TaxID=135621 RepID=A0A2N8STX1_STUST|nr:MULTISPECIES: hypothetical protein [Pseudomonadaceae]MCQ4249133.1 hypothetical protein [Stutzerimonas stutzeri]PNG05938.1 hypothetical protein CXL00_08890 [Stutzerimonas stutzeri]UPQ83593.1 hypothetical protein M0M42_04080 [Pseudomonas knackmussii]
MPIPPRPLTFSCPACSWQRTTIPLSDALLMGRDWFAHCPQCHHASLELRSASQKEIMKTRLAHFLCQDLHP